MMLMMMLIIVIGRPRLQKRQQSATRPAASPKMPQDGPTMTPTRSKTPPRRPRRPQDAPRRLNNASITEYPEHQSPITEIRQDGFKTPKSSFRILAQVLPKSFQILSFLTLLLHGLPSGYNHIGGVFSGGRGRRCIAGGVFDPPPPWFTTGAGRARPGLEFFQSSSPSNFLPKRFPGGLRRRTAAPPRPAHSARSARSARLLAQDPPHFAREGCQNPPQDGPRRPQDGPRGPQDGPRRPQEAPRRPQDASKRPWEPFWCRFGVEFGPRRPLKSLVFLRFLWIFIYSRDSAKIHKNPRENIDFQGSGAQLRPPCGPKSVQNRRPGGSWGPRNGPKPPGTPPKTLPGPPGTPPGPPEDPPGPPQRAPRSSRDPPMTPPRTPRDPREAPRRPPGAPQVAPGAPREPSRTPRDSTGAPRTTPRPPRG